MDLQVEYDLWKAELAMRDQLSLLNPIPKGEAR
jgi:hypothetical protein